MDRLLAQASASPPPVSSNDESEPEPSIHDSEGVEIDELRSTTPPQAPQRRTRSTSAGGRSSGLSDVGSTPEPPSARAVHWGSPLTQEHSVEGSLDTVIQPLEGVRRTARATAGQPPPSREPEALARPQPSRRKAKRPSKEVELSEEEAQPPSIKRSKGKSMAKEATGPRTRTRANTDPGQPLVSLDDNDINKRTPRGARAARKATRRVVPSSAALRGGTSSPSSSRSVAKPRAKPPPPAPAIIRFLYNWVAKFDEFEVYHVNGSTTLDGGLAYYQAGASGEASAKGRELGTDCFFIDRTAELFTSVNARAPPAKFARFDAEGGSMFDLAETMKYYAENKHKFLRVVVTDLYSRRARGDQSNSSITTENPLSQQASQVTSTSQLTPAPLRLPLAAQIDQTEADEARTTSQRSAREEKAFLKKFWAELTSRWTCMDPDCPNNEYVACLPVDNGEEYTHNPINYRLLRIWRDDVKAGRSTIERPSIEVIGRIQKEFFKSQQKATRRREQSRGAQSSTMPSTTPHAGIHQVFHYSPYAPSGTLAPPPTPPQYSGQAPASITPPESSQPRRSSSPPAGVDEPSLLRHFYNHLIRRHRPYQQQLNATFADLERGCWNLLLLRKASKEDLAEAVPLYGIRIWIKEEIKAYMRRAAEGFISAEGSTTEAEDERDDDEL
ncbi:Hypothetical protein D9617_69g078030 [Elsinoe fawcettii]|nr:Hypothetical protein D9617_69g078030 [Elsinoe fawcettii]